MKEEPPQQKVVAFTPRPREFEARVRHLAADTSKVKWSQHARDRMAERDIPIRVALEVLRRGLVVGTIEPGSYPGEWKAKIVRNVKGRRDVGVVVIVVRDDHLKVKTVEWEDMR